MDAETRHQLKTNELGELLERLRDFNNPYVKYPLIVAGVLVVGWIGYSSFAYFHRHSLELAWQKLGTIERSLDPNDQNYASAVADLEQLVRDAADPALAATGRLQLARLRYEEALRDPSQRAAKLDAARTVLREVRAASGTPVALDAAAAFALATTCESLAEFGDRAAQLAEARGLYEALTTQSRFAGSPFVVLARERLTTLGALEPPISLMPGEAPAPAAAIGPPVPAGDSAGPALTVDDGINVKQLTPEEVEQLLGKINPDDLPAEVQPAPGEAPPPAPEPQDPPADDHG